MTSNEPLTPGEEVLAAFESEPDLRRILQPEHLTKVIAELRACENVLQGTALLCQWSLRYPNTTGYLLGAIAKDPVASLELAPVILSYSSDPDSADEILAKAFPGLTGPYRDAAADRPGVRQILKLPEGVGYEAVPEPDPSWLWPKGKPFPDADTVEGVQARLNSLGYGAGPVNGEWSDLTRRAFVRWQIHEAFTPTGELDERSIEELAFQTD